LLVGKVQWLECCLALLDNLEKNLDLHSRGVVMRCEPLPVAEAERRIEAVEVIALDGDPDITRMVIDVSLPNRGLDLQSVGEHDSDDVVHGGDILGERKWAVHGEHGECLLILVISPGMEYAK